MADPENIARGENPGDSCCIQTCKDYTCNTGTLKPGHETIIRSSALTSEGPEVNCCENQCPSPLNYFAGPSPNCICSPSPGVHWFTDDDRTGPSFLDGLFCLKGGWGVLYGVLIIIGIICAVVGLYSKFGGSKSRSKTTSIRSSQNPSGAGVNVTVQGASVDSSKKVTTPS